MTQSNNITDRKTLIALVTSGEWRGGAGAAGRRGSPAISGGSGGGGVAGCDPLSLPSTGRGYGAA